MKKTLTSVGNTLGSKLTSFKNLSVLVVILLLMSGGVKGQSSANYTFTTGASSLNVMTGSTSLITGNNDDWGSTVFPIGFNFIYMGTSYSHISVNSNGQARLHTSSGATALGNSAITSYSSATVTIAPMAGDNEVNNGMSYLVSGIEPNRKLIIEWNNFYAYYTNITNSGNMQLVLNESTGVLEFLYGSIFNSQSIATTRSIFHSSSNTANSSAFITVGTSPSQSTAAISPTTNSFAASVQIANLANRFYTFTPLYNNTPSNPTNLTFTTISATTETPNWVDNSSDESFFIVTRANDAGFTTGVVITNVASTTTAGTGTAYTLAQTGLSPGTTYYYKIQAANEASVVGSGLTGSQVTTAGATYYWVGNTGGTWNTPGNWNTSANNTGTSRSTVATTDVLIVDGTGTTAGGTMSISIDLTSFSIGQLKVTSNTALTLSSSSTATRTITITGGGGDDLIIENGSSIILNNATNAVAFAFSGTGNTGDISGTLNIGGSTSNAITTTGGTGTVVTVSSTGIVNNSVAASSGNLTGTAATLVFANGSALNVSGATTGAPAIPLATWGATSTLTISGITTSTSSPTNNVQSFGNFIYNCPLATGTMSFFTSSTTAVIKGDLTITAGATAGTGIFRALTTGTLTVNGNVNVLQGKFQSASGNGTFIVLGNTNNSTNGILEINGGTYSQRGATLTNDGSLTGPSGTLQYLNLTGSAAQTLAGSGTVLTNLGTLSLQNTAGLNITHTNPVIVARVNLFQGTITGSNKITFGTGSVNCLTQIGATSLTTPGGSFDAIPTFNLGTGTYGVSYAQESVSRTSGFEIPSTRTLNSLTLSNSNGLTIAGGALSSAALTFSAGCGNITTSSSNVLTISGTTTGAITRTSTTAYVNGPLALTLPASLLTGSTYLFPIGKGTLNSLELVNPTTNAGGTVTIQSEVFDANSGGTAGLNMGSLNTDRYWATSITSGSGNFTNTFIKLNDASVISTSAISSSATQTGSYDLVGGTLPTIVAGTSITSATTASTSIPGFYNIGTKAVPMAYTSSTTTQAVTTPILTNTTNQQIIDVQVVTTGNASPLSITSMTFNTTGTTSTADITNAKIFYTGTSSTFATTTQFGSTNATPNGSYNITGSQALAEGTNYFWLTYDIPNGATVNNVVDAECTSLTVGSAQTPTASAPTGTRTIKAQLNGTYSIGASQTSPNYSSLTSAISDLNSYGVSGAVIFQLMSDYSSSSSETYPLTINAITGGSATNTLTIKPASGVTASISGLSASNAIIKLNGADYVTIDGSNNGTSSRNLTINNTGGTSAGIWVGSIGGAGNGANNNTIKNLIIFGNSGTVSGNYGIISSANSAFATAASDNDNLTITNNSIYKVYTGISALTSSSAGLDANGLSITNNSIGTSSATDYITYRGIELSYATSPSINQNNIFNIITSVSLTNIGINIDAGVVNGTISGNTITGLRSTTANGYGSYGINFSSAVGTSGVVVANNIISDILTSNYSATSSTYNAFGIRITGGNSLKIYYNTINLFGTPSLGASAGLSANLCVTTAVTGLEVKNNIFKNTTSFSYMSSVVANVWLISSLTFDCNYNDFYGTSNTNNTYYTGYNGASGWITTLANWRTSTTQDANSISIAPTFTSATDLHLTSANADLKAGTYISSVLTDYDGDTRNVLTPTMGADEIYIANLWTGTSSTAFATAGNWDDNAVPSSGANITIPTGVTNKPVLASDKTIGTLALGSGTTLSIGSNTLTINGAVSGTGTLTGSSTSNLTIAGAATTLNFTGGSRSLNNLSLGASGAATLGTALDIYGTIGFTTGGSLNMNAQAVALKSTASATASISDLTSSTLSGATNLTVERYIPANRKYRFLAAPVIGATAVQWRDNGGTTPGIGTHITGGSVGSNFDQSTLNAPSAFWYNEANAGSITDVGSGASSDPGWTAFTDGNTQALTNGKGFRVFVRGDRTLSLTGSIPTANNTTLSVTGTYPANSVTIATTKSASNTNSGFNLVGNPYPSTIDWNAITKGTGITNTYSTFNPSANAYVQWNGTTGDATRYIASGQAFFVYQESGTTSSITIAEANKVSNAAGNFFRNKLTDHLKVSMKYDSANYDAAFIHFREDALNEFDNYDGLKFQNAGVNIASVGSGSKRYNINSLASLTETTEIPLSVLGSALTNFELKFEDVESFKNHELYLIDHYLNKMILLSDGFTYPIELSSDSASVKDGRFKIVFVQKVTGIQNNNKNAHAFILYPNPAANSIHILLDAKNTNSENVSFEIFNQLGARLQQGNLDFTTAKDQAIAIDNLAQGSYFIKLQSKSIHQTIKFIK